jgi:hypothetical protein
VPADQVLVSGQRQAIAHPVDRLNKLRVSQLLPQPGDRVVQGAGLQVGSKVQRLFQQYAARDRPSACIDEQAQQTLLLVGEGDGLAVAVYQSLVQINPRSSDSEDCLALVSRCRWRPEPTVSMRP